MAIISAGDAEVIVDDELAPFLSIFSWHLSNSGYAAGCVCGKKTLMHRLILNAREPYVVDHINRNKMDNRRDNLRQCLFQENSCNTTTRGKYRGIVRDKRDGVYSARIVIDGKIYSFAYSTDPIVSATAWDKAARFHYGQFAVTNFAGTASAPAWELLPRSRNVRNRTSGYRGVRRTMSGNWQALFRKKHLGVFKTQEEAAKAYDEAAVEALGSRAALNFQS